MIEIRKFGSADDLSEWTKETKMTIRVISIVYAGSVWCLFYEVLSYGTKTTIPKP